MSRKWLEGVVIGVCIALVVLFVQPLVVGETRWIQGGGIVLALVLVCMLQLVLAIWNRSRP